MRNKSMFTRTSTTKTVTVTNKTPHATAMPSRHHVAAKVPHVGLISRPMKRKTSTESLLKAGRETPELQSSIMDKVILVLPIEAVSPATLESIADRFSTISGIKSIAPKGDSYQKRYVLTCPSATKIIFGVLPADSRMRFGVKIIMNPSQMSDEDTTAFIGVLKLAFLPNPKATLSKFLIQRVDQAYDHPVAINDLVVQAVGSPVEEKYYVASDRSGRIQTWYCGSVESQERFISYNQVDSDAFKVDHGEKPSRPSPYGDAEVVIQKRREQPDMTRFEARRVFRQPLALDEVDAKAQPFGRFAIYVVDTACLQSAPLYFTLYLDSVRLRGVDGARKQLLLHWPGRAGKKQLAEFEEFLQQCMAPWWDRAQLDCSVKNGLQQTASWRALRYLTHTS